MSLLFDSTIKISVILTAGLLATMFLRHRSAAVRHWVIAVAISCAAATPVLSLILPSWQIGLSSWSSQTSTGRSGSIVSETTVLEGQPPTMGAPAGPAAAGDDPSRPSAFMGITFTWSAGVSVSLLILVVGLARLRWLASRARRVTNGPWVERARDISSAVGLRRPITLFQSNHPELLVTWGLARPKVLLPTGADDWRDDRIRVVLRHELAHISRGDWGVQMAAELLRAVYWFHPLVWIACSRLRQESERACDDAVLNGGVDGQDYATHLLDLARTLRRPAWLAAPAMARPSSLEGRISAMLNTRVNRSPLSASSRIATVVALLSLTAPLAGLGAQNTFFTFSGTVTDITGRYMPDAKVALTNRSSQAKYEVRSGRTGRFEFVGLPNGEYALETALPGFRPLKDVVAVAGRNIDRNLELQVGELEETITVRDSTGRDNRAEDVQARRERIEDIRQQVLDRCSSDSMGPVGGHIVQPRQLTRVAPVYPEHLKAAQVEGTVTIDAIIGPDGNVRDTTVVDSPDPAFGNAAAEAIRQWQYSQTLLNCVPVDVHMRVTTNFRSQP